MKAPQLYTVQIGDTLHVYDKESTPIVQASIKRALKKGLLIIHRSGWREWIDTSPIHDENKTGSAAYIWDKSGDRIKCARERHVIKDGEHTTETLRPVFKGWDAVFND